MLGDFPKPKRVAEALRTRFRDGREGRSRRQSHHPEQAKGSDPKEEELPLWIYEGTSASSRTPFSSLQNEIRSK